MYFSDNSKGGKCLKTQDWVETMSVYQGETTMRNAQCSVPPFTLTSSAPSWQCQRGQGLASVRLLMRYYTPAWLRCRSSEGWATGHVCWWILQLYCGKCCYYRFYRSKTKRQDAKNKCCILYLTGIYSLWKLPGSISALFCIMWMGSNFGVG